MRILRTWAFEWWEMGILKVCLISLGIVIGLYFYEYLIDIAWLWWALFIAGVFYFILKLLGGK